MLDSFAPLFAQSSPAHAATGWTDKEVLLYLLGAVGGTLFIMVPIAWGVVRLLVGKAHRRVARLEAENRELRRAQENGRDTSTTDVLKEDLVKSTKRVGELEATLSEVRKQAEGFEKVVQGLEGERDELKREHNEACEKLQTEERRIRNAVKKDGVTWTEKVLSTNKIEFKSLDPDERRTPIISVLNLKGGVGKTTTTANLGAALARRGWRVLLVDLDLQGSLSSLFLSDTAQEERHRQQRLVGDFLEKSFDGGVSEHPRLRRPGSPGLWVQPRTDDR
jgi:hypothetical protein